MNSIYYGLALIAILVIIQWYIVNDRGSQSDGSIGILAIRSKTPSDISNPAQSAKKNFRRKR